VEDINGVTFNLYDKLKIKAVIVLYTDILNNEKNVLALEKFISTRNDIYYCIIMDYGNNLKTLKKEVKDKKYTFPIYIDDTKRMYKQLGIDRISTTILIDKDKFIKAYIKRNINSEETYDDILKGVIK